MKSQKAETIRPKNSKVRKIRPNIKKAKTNFYSYSFFGHYFGLMSFWPYEFFGLLKFQPFEFGILKIRPFVVRSCLAEMAMVKEKVWPKIKMPKILFGRKQKGRTEVRKCQNSRLYYS